MDLEELKNIDLKEIFSKLKSGGLSDKKVVIKFSIGLFAILFFLIGYYAFISPIIERQEKQINLMNENKNKIEEFNNNIITLRATIRNIADKVDWKMPATVDNPLVFDEIKKAIKPLGY